MSHKIGINGEGLLLPHVSQGTKTIKAVSNKDQHICPRSFASQANINFVLRTSNFHEAPIIR